MKQASLESVRWKTITYADRLANTAIRGVCPDYGEIRSETPVEGRWINTVACQRGYSSKLAGSGSWGRASPLRRIASLALTGPIISLITTDESTTVLMTSA